MEICRINVVDTGCPQLKKTGYISSDKSREDVVEKTNKFIIVKVRRDIFLNSHFYELMTGLEIPTLSINYKSDVVSEYEIFKITGLKEDIRFYGATYSCNDEKTDEKVCWGKERVSREDINKYIKEHDNISNWYEELMSYFYPNHVEKSKMSPIETDKEQTKYLAKILAKTNKY